MSDEKLPPTMGWDKQCQEWDQIKDEFIDRNHGQGVTAYVVTMEQRRRMALRGQHPMTMAEIQAWYQEQVKSGAIPG